ncbi:SRPBCC family protein [Spongiactinospora rosea]|nr:SRPBCC family protein [Spongiactinospora rosea]
MPELIHEIDVPLTAASTVFSLIGDVEEAPQFLPPHVYARYIKRDGKRDLVERWVANDGGAIQKWTVWQERSGPPYRIVFEHLHTSPPVRQMGGEWTFTQRGDSTAVWVMHNFEVVDDDPAAAAPIEDDFEERVPRQLKYLVELARNLDDIRARTVTCERSVVIPADVERVYERLLAGEAGDETDWMQVGLPFERVVYKRRPDRQLPGMNALTGEYELTADGSGTRVTARRTATFDQAIVDEVGRKALDDALLTQLRAIGA